MLYAFVGYFVFYFLILNLFTNLVMYHYFFIFDTSSSTKLETLARWVVPFYGMKDVAVELGVSTIFLSISLVLISVGLLFPFLIYFLLSIPASYEVVKVCGYLWKSGLILTFLMWLFLELKLISSLRLHPANILLLMVCPFLVDINLIYAMRKKIKERE